MCNTRTLQPSHVGTPKCIPFEMSLQTLHKTWPSIGKMVSGFSENKTALFETLQEMEIGLLETLQKMEIGLSQTLQKMEIGLLEILQEMKVDLLEIFFPLKLAYLFHKEVLDILRNHQQSIAGWEKISVLVI